MQGPLAQITALVLFGNRFLSANHNPAFYPGNSTLQFCRSVNYVVLADRAGKPEELSYASNPAEWFETIRRDGVVGLRLLHVPVNDRGISDRMSAGFVGGGGRWLIEAVHAATSDYWEARWTTTGRDEPDRRIWIVTYGRVEGAASHAAVQGRTAAAIKNDLNELLPRIEAFAEAHKLSGFASAFRRARTLLTASDPLAAVYHSDIAPSGMLATDEQAILAAAQAAWVFGAMGSWNDVSFAGSDQQTYDEVSEALFRLLNEAILVAVNSTFTVPLERKPWWRIW